MSKMPVLFIGHGSPMNAIEDNSYTKSWRELVKRIPKPEAILSISAHWFTKGTKIMNEAAPKTIHDMYGFPEELYKIIYHSPGSPELAAKSKALLSKASNYDNSWGIDHGTWSVLVHMYPAMDIPVFQISIDATATPAEHYQIGRDLRNLREQGVLILGSGNIVHNLGILDFSKSEGGYDWAYEFDNHIKENIQNKNHDNIIHYSNLGTPARLAVPSPDHFNPLLYVLGSTYENDKISVYNDSCMMGSLSMTSYLFEE
jgi:4,5-DOPA dioxygenase extradiol